MDALLRRRAIIASGGFSIIPYIRGGADGSYIDTGIIPDNNTRVIVWARNFNPVPVSQMLFGYMDDGASTNSFGIGSWGAASCGRIGVYFANYTNPYTIVNDAFRYLGGYHKYELNGKVFSVDDVTLATSTSTDTITTSYSMHLFGRSSGGTHTAMTLPADICACKIYKNGTLVRDYTAVNSPSVGLYDAVSNTVFTNAGTGSFTYGTFNPNAYAPLEYVSCTGAQYFDSGIKGTYALPIVASFRPSTSTDSMWILGGRTSSSSKRCDFQLSSDGKTFYFGYQSTGNTVYNTTSQAGNDLVWIKSNNTSTLYKNNAQLGTITGTTGSSFSTDYNIGIGTLIQAGSLLSTVAFKGRIRYIGLGSSRSYVPALVNGVAGLYDTYNDTFKPSSSSTPFTAGTTL